MERQTASEKKDRFILIVEDSQTQAEQLKFILEESNYNVVHAFNGAEALEMLQKRKPSLIISDILMPVMGGFELCKSIKTNTHTRTIPVILLTSLSSSDDLLEGLACGADNFLTKPYNTGYLLAQVDRIFESRELAESDRGKVSFETQIRGENRIITADQQQMFSLLFSTYDAAVQRNNELVQSQFELSRINERLEDLVEERTAELSEEIAEREKTQEELKQSLSILEATLESAIDGILVVDLNGKFLKNNSKFVDLWNIPESMINSGNDDEVLDFILSQLKYPDQFEGKLINAGIEKMAESFNVLDLLDGRVFELNSHPQLIDDKIVGRVLSFLDVTERMHAIADLRESEKRVELAIQSADLGMWDLDLVNDTTWRTVRHDQIFGYKTLQPEWGQKIFFQHVLPDDRAVVEQRFAEAFIHDRLHFECRVNGADGIMRWISAYGLVLRDEKNEPVRMLGTIMDITNRKDAEEEIKLKNTQLEKNNIEKDKFFSIMAHDLKSPFNVFLGGTELLLNDVDELSSDEIRRLASSIHKSASTIYELLENLLEWSRLQRGKTSFAPEEFQLNDKISAVFELVKQSAQKKEIVIDVEILDHLMVFADVHMFETILRNLIFNALKFTHKGGSVSVKAWQFDEKYVGVSITDTGIGMTQEIVNNLFSINNSTYRNGTAGEPSTGLGLIICKDFVEKNGGTFWVESEVDKGSVFSFTLPVPESSKAKP